MSVWIKHSGTECPVPPDTVVRIRTMARSESEWDIADVWEWKYVTGFQIENPEGVWIKHNGGPRPIPPETTVQIRRPGERLGGGEYKPRRILALE